MGIAELLVLWKGRLEQQRGQDAPAKNMDPRVATGVCHGRQVALSQCIAELEACIAAQAAASDGQ